MMIFGTSGRGKFRSVDIDASGGQGVQLSVPSGNPVGSSSLVTSFGAVQSENYSVSQCLNGGIYLYTFGHDPNRSQFTVGVTSFLNSCKDGVGADLQGALSTYSGGRVSQSKAKAVLTVGQGSLSGYLTGQNIEVVNNELSIIQTTYTFIALDAQQGGG